MFEKILREGERERRFNRWMIFLKETFVLVGNAAPLFVPNPHFAD
jgi:hypothetical protein